mgnify:CR=1 FL=1
MVPARGEAVPPPPPARYWSPPLLLSQLIVPHSSTVEWGLGGARSLAVGLALTSLSVGGREMKWVKLMIAALTLHSAQALSPFVSPPRHVMHSSSQRTICSRVQRVMCSGPKQNDNNKLMANVYGTMFGLAIAQQLSLCAGVAAGRLGLWNPPPVNM